MIDGSIEDGGALGDWGGSSCPARASLQIDGLDAGSGRRSSQHHRGVARTEFVENALSGARRRDAARTATSKRDDLLLFRRCEGLYRAVLEEMHERNCSVERDLVPGIRLEEAMNRLTAFTFDYHAGIRISSRPSWSRTSTTRGI